MQIYTANEDRVWQSFLGADYDENTVQTLRAVIDERFRREGIRLITESGGTASARGEQPKRESRLYFVPEDVVPLGTHESDVAGIIIDRMDHYVAEALGRPVEQIRTARTTRGVDIDGRRAARGGETQVG